jgi:hypothetical protein
MDPPAAPQTSTKSPKKMKGVNAIKEGLGDVLTIAQDRRSQFTATTERMREMQSEVEAKALRISQEVRVVAHGR